MATLEIRNISKSFGATKVLHEINLDLIDGEFLVLVGPSGCGKSTLMNIVAGLEAPTTGQLLLAGKDITLLEPDERDIALVFQSYALYPNMTLAKNIEFPVEMLKVPKEKRAQVVADVSKMLQIEHLLDRKPKQLSGGQRQRVAIGRALARHPSLFLFDEPLSNLDAKLRVDMRAELKKLHLSTGVTTIYVTHDQIEAMTLGTRIAVLKDGLIQQLATPMELYEKPANTFVASFIGSPAINFCDASLNANGNLEINGKTLNIGLPEFANKKVRLGIRPEDIRLEPGHLTGKISLIEPTGAESYVLVAGEFGEFTVRMSGLCKQSLGDAVELNFSAENIHLFDANTGMRMN